MATRPVSVSVVVATFNGERFLAEQLRSIVTQSRLPDEIVIADDGSTDDTLAIVEEVKAKAPVTISWRVVTQKSPLGIARNFAAGVSAASSDLVALADQDDWWAPEKLATLVTYFVTDPRRLLVHSDAELVDESGHLLGMTLSQSLRMTRSERRGLIAGRALAQLLRRNLVTGHTVMMRRELAAKAGEIPPGWLHDEWWALVAAGLGGVVFCPTILGHYRQHDVNQVGATRSGLARLMERFSEPQSAFRARHSLRHEGLGSFLESADNPLDSDATRRIKARIAHYQWQAALPPSRLQRVLPIGLRVIRGDYQRYRRGLFDALRDLFQPGN